MIRHGTSLLTQIGEVCHRTELSFEQFKAFTLWSLVYKIQQGDSFELYLFVSSFIIATLLTSIQWKMLSQLCLISLIYNNCHREFLDRLI